MFESIDNLMQYVGCFTNIKVFRSHLDCMSSIALSEV